MSEPLSGRTIGQYELHEVVGRGGMSVIYRASQPRMERDVAIKVIAGTYAHHPAFIRRFEDEARAYARLQHPHILPVYDVGLEGDWLYLVMAYMPGGTLARRIAANPGGLPLEEIVCIIAQVASALDHAHAQGIVHCDIKPGNILLDGRGNAYLGDFGIAQLNATNRAPSQGTYAYMAPELGGGAPAAPASDIFSLGIVVFEMLAGSRPFEAHSREALLEAHSEPAMPDVRRERADLPTGVQVVLEQTLSKEPAARPLHATSVAQSLMRACGLVGLPCADVGDEEPSLEDSNGQGLASAEEAPLDLQTPPPLVGVEDWSRGASESQPAFVHASPERDASPTAVASPTQLFQMAPSSKGRWRSISSGKLLVLIWLVVLCVLLEVAALVVVVVPALHR